MRGDIPLFVLLLVSAACAGEGSSDGARFTEITAEVGVEVAARPWPDGSFFLPEIMGPGLALFDYDGDGDLDILQLRAPPPGDRRAPAPNRLWRQEPDGRFVDVSAASGLDDPGFAQGVAVADVDDDGDLDVYLSNFGPDAFYLNDGDGTFSERTAAAGFGGDAWSSSAAFCDYDRDGDLDLYVAHYLRLDYQRACRSPSGAADYCGPQLFDGVPDTLYRNEGGGRFTDASATAGISNADGGKRAKGLGVVCADLTGDDRVDFYVANDGEANQLWVSDGRGRFTEQAMVRGVAVNRRGNPEASMGLALGDVDGDGRFDLYMTHLALENNTLYVGGAQRLYADRTLESGLAAFDLPFTGFGCELADFDHDGDLDLAVVNGRVRRDPARSGGAGEPFWPRYAETNLLLVNDGTGSFADGGAVAASFASTREVSRGLAAGDLDRDGDLDLVLSNVDGSMRIYRNDLPTTGNHWLVVRAMTGPRDAVGAIVTLHASDRRWVRPILSGSSYLSSSEPVAHFGLGAADRVDRVEVVWPDGSRESFDPPATDRRVVLVQGEGRRP